MFGHDTLMLAPMAGFTDHAMRAMCRRYGADYSVTEMVSAAALCWGDAKTAALARLYEDDGPCAVQLFGHDPAQMERAAAIIAKGGLTGRRPAAIDLNMGCPVKKIVTGGDGSALMKDPALCARMVEAALRGASPYGVPVTVKIRAGWDAEHKNAVEVALACVRAGASGIVVHARTRMQMYAPGADWSVIAAVRDAVPDSVPVIGNGDVTDAASYGRMMRETGCSGAAIGREALGDPWVFSEIRAMLSGADFTPPTEAQRTGQALALARDVIAEKGEAVGVRECRGRVSHFLSGMRGAAAMRAAVQRAVTLSDLEEILCGIPGSI